MTPLKHSFPLFALMLVFGCCIQSFAQEGLITVKDYPTEPEGQEDVDLESHKSGDVEIQRVISGFTRNEEGYAFIWYHDISGKLRAYYFYLRDTTYYDQGFYNWKNDTIVAVKIYNSETKEEWKVELYPTREENSSGGVILKD